MSQSDRANRREIKTLCKGLAAGDENCFSQFYTHWFPTLLSWSQSFIPSDEHLALDIVQETMLRVIRSLPALDSHAALVAWLRAANRSAAIDLIRRRIASQARERAAAHPESHASQTPALASLHPDLNALARALATLSPDDQLLLRLRSDSSATFEQLATSLEATPDSLYGRARRALARLRTLLSEEASDG